MILARATWLLWRPTKLQTAVRNHNPGKRLLIELDDSEGEEGMVVMEEPEDILFTEITEPEPTGPRER